MRRTLIIRTPSVLYKGGFFLTAYLAITPAALARRTPAPRLPLVHIAYTIDENGCLARCRAPEPPRGGMMGLCDRCPAHIRYPDALCRAVAGECRSRGYSGVLADFDTPCPDDRPAFLEALARSLGAQGLPLYCPLALNAAGARLIIGTALSGGSLRAMLEEAAARCGAQRLALDLERVRMDFPLPCPTGCGTPLTRSELAALRERHPISTYYSRELMANYFTYTENRSTHFVLFDDAGTLRKKAALAQSLGIQEAFLMYPEVPDIIAELEETL